MKNHTLWAYDTYFEEKNRKQAEEDFIEQYGHSPSEDELDDYCNLLSNNDYDDMITEVKYHEKNHGEKQYIVLAKIHTWEGVFDGGKIITGLAKVLSECSEDFNTYFYRYNQLRVEAIHHDGTNQFFIRELTETGIEFLERHQHDYTDKDLHQKLFYSTKYSHMVSLFPKVYGWL